MSRTRSRDVHVVRSARREKVVVRFLEGRAALFPGGAMAEALRYARDVARARGGRVVILRGEEVPLRERVPRWRVLQLRRLVEE